MVSLRFNHFLARAPDGCVRKVAKLSQAELGRLAGVGKTAVFDLEHKKETIRFDVVRKILERS